MKLLIDTHIFIWLQIKSGGISAQRMQILKNPINTLFLSLASVWEMQLKIQNGKFKFPKPLPEIIREQRQFNNLQILSITPEHIYELENLPFHHKDPFDRPLIAQAVIENFALVTDDPKFSDYPVKLI